MSTTDSVRPARAHYRDKDSKKDRKLDCAAEAPVLPVPAMAAGRGGATPEPTRPLVDSGGDEKSHEVAHRFGENSEF